ncbi:MAG: hypothetical protein ACI8S6_004643 [Myxococcota bacterium]
MLGGYPLAVGYDEGMRFLTPILFFAAAGYVYWYNGSQGEAVLMFPPFIIEVLYPDAAGDPHAMGEASVVLLVAMGLLTLLWNLSASWRYRRHLKRNIEQPK